jgi:hypothetical protein
MTLLISLDVIAIKPLINVVIPPNHNIVNNIDGVYSKINDDLTNTKTPLQTIVAACNKELTGVGPYMAPNNQACNPN